jgi:hypothetical protein
MADQTQPQDVTYSTPGIDPLLSARLHLEAAFNHSCKVFEQHVADVKEFFEIATKLLMTASKAMDDLRKAFIDFEAE